MKVSRGFIILALLAILMGICVAVLVASTVGHYGSDWWSAFTAWIRDSRP